MFTGNSVQLKDFDGRYGLKLIRDCSFSHLGKLPTKLDRRLIPCSSASHVQSAMQDSSVAGLIVTPELADACGSDKGVGIAAHPMRTMQDIHCELSEREGFFWENFDSRIDPTAKIHPTAHVEAQNVVIGAGTSIGPFAYVGERSLIGANCKIGPHSVIGWESFEIDANKEEPKILPHVGGIRIDDGVEMQSHCAVARCAFGGFTRLRRYAKLDGQILIAHDADIGERVKIAAGVTVCGRASVGNDAYLGPASVVSNGVEVGQSAEVSIGAVVTRKVKDGVKVSGNFALAHTKWMKLIASVAR